MNTRKIILFSMIALVALILGACGGSNTYSPTAQGTSPVVPAQITISISPNPGATFPGGTVQFTATVTGTQDTAVTWSVLTAGGGTITSTGLYTAPQVQANSKRQTRQASPKSSSVFPSALRGSSSKVKGFWEDIGGQATIQAVSHADPSKIATAVVNINNVEIAVSPQDPTVTEGQTQQFSATVTGASGGVTWSLANGGGKIISTTGLFTAGLVPGTYTVVASGVAQQGSQGTTSVTVVPPTGISIGIQPTAPEVTFSPGSSTQLTATVFGTTDQGVTWSVVPNAQGVTFGSISQTGLFSIVAGQPYQVTVQVKATSKADPSKSALASIFVNNNQGG